MPIIFGTVHIYLLNSHCVNNSPQNGLIVSWINQ